MAQACCECFSLLLIFKGQSCTRKIFEEQHSSKMSKNMAIVFCMHIRQFCTRYCCVNDIAFESLSVRANWLGLGLRSLPSERRSCSNPRYSFIMYAFVLVGKRSLTAEEALEGFFSLPDGSENEVSSDSSNELAVPPTSALAPVDSLENEENIEPSRKKKSRKTFCA